MFDEIYEIMKKEEFHGFLETDPTSYKDKLRVSVNLDKISYYKKGEDDVRIVAK